MKHLFLLVILLIVGLSAQAQLSRDTLNYNNGCDELVLFTDTLNLNYSFKSDSFLLSARNIFTINDRAAGGINIVVGYDSPSRVTFIADQSVQDVVNTACNKLFQVTDDATNTTVAINPYAVERIQKYQGSKTLILLKGIDKANTTRLQIIAKEPFETLRYALAGCGY